MKIICIGRNYEDHAKEMGSVIPKFPIIFLKPDSAILPKRNPFYLPEIAKSFDQSAVVGEKFIGVNSSGSVNFSLQKNNKVVQKGNANQMIFSIDEIISYVSKFMTLKIGDLIFSGTPSGVGPVKIGDELKGFIENQEIFKVKIK